MSILAREGRDAPVVSPLAMSFSLCLFQYGKLKSVMFFDAPGFAQAKASAITAVESREAEDAEVHDDSAGLVFRYTQLLS
jgi:hypothetical protein